MSEARTFFEDKLNERLQPMAEAVNFKISNLNANSSRLTAREKVRLAREIEEAKAEMKAITVKEYLHEEIAKANRSFNAKETSSSASDSTDSPPSGPFDEELLIAPITVDLKQIESISDLATKKSLTLLHESLSDKVELVNSKSRKCYKFATTEGAETDDLVTILLAIKHMKEDITRDNATIIKALIADRLQ